MKKRKEQKNCIWKKLCAVRKAWDEQFALPRFVLFLMPVVLMLAGGGYVYAKYYSVNAQRGIAIATGIYFTANYAVEMNTEESDDSLDEYVESLVKSDYQGGNHTYNFEVRNYENNLLFNSSDVTIPYEVAFWVEEEPEGAVYTVSLGEGESVVTKTLQVGEANAVVFANQKITGGAALANKYKVAITVEDASAGSHIAVPVYVRVQTADGSIITRTLKGKMVMNNVDRPENFIESQKFIVPDETEGMDPVVKFEKLNKLSMLTYEIRTVGEVLAADEVTEELKLSWNPDIFQIDLFDKAYREWLKNNPQKTKPDEDANGWQYITIKAMPYSAESIGFFRGSAFEEQVTNAVTEETNGMDILHSFIRAEKYAVTE